MTAGDTNTQEILGEVTTDGRSTIRKAWERLTYNPIIGQCDYLIARGVTRFSLVDRLFILFGRDVVTIVTSDTEPDFGHEHTYRVIDQLKIEAGTQPRRYW